MNRTILTTAGVFGASSLLLPLLPLLPLPLLVDSAVKGTALLVLAAVAAVILRHGSAATRHLVWLLAIVAVLVVPVLSAMLPQWRVLPQWADLSPEPVAVETSPPSIAGPADGAVEWPRNAEPVEVGERPSATAYQPAAELPDSPPAPVTPEIIPESAVRRWNWVNALPRVWAAGFCVLTLRLVAARWVLWNSERRGTVIRPSRRPARATRDPIGAALEAACLQLGIGRPVTLLIHPDETVPVVWGILRCRLLLPAAARRWSGEQLRSVLLHELAHVKRRDTIAQLLAQVACALHWFNPLVWFAAWRLGVERERACDDLVLASGVRPSAYAGHLLDVVTGLPPAARWTQFCGLAMARKSSLEGRLVAVLSENLNRRGVSAALAAIALAVAASVAVPVAMLRAADEEPGAPVRRQQRESRKPEGVAKLPPGAEQKLRWGEPVNGMRAAIAIRPSPDGPKAAGDVPDLYLAVQNVSDAPVRLSDAAAAPGLRYLKVRLDGKTQAGFVSEAPTGTDVTLQPREAAFLLMFVSDWKDKGGRTSGSLIAQDALGNPQMTFVAELTIEKAPAGAWTGKLVTGETTAATAAGKPMPKDKEARALFKLWRGHARRNGNIPGGLIGRLGDKVKEFIRNNTGDAAGDPYAKKMQPLVPRLDAARDWTPAQAAALLDDVAAVTPIPLDTTMDEAAERTFKTGSPLPPGLADAPWGEAQPNGLRMAWLLEPRAAGHRLGTPLKSRILFHNAGKDTVVFRTRTWHQSGQHQARDAKGADVKVESVFWTTIGRLVPFRLAPGEFVEVTAAGIGVGPMNDSEDWQGTRVGSWVEAKAGDDVTFAPGPVPLHDGNEGPPPGGGPGWWRDFITDRLGGELPLPADADGRTLLLDRAVRGLFGTEPAAEEAAAFVADREPAALAALANRLANRPGVTPCAGTLTSGETRFRVLPPDPDAANEPRTASNPGRYTLRDGAVLAVSRRPDGERIVNEAGIEFSSPDPAGPATGGRHELKLPDGYGTWAAAWVRGGSVLWVREKGGGVRGYDIADPAEVKETTLDEPADLENVPKPILDALRAALDVPGAPTQAPATPN